MKHLPNILTLCNLLCGCIATTFCFGGSLNFMITGSYFILAAAGFDFSDGFAARALKAYSPLGKQLDSLADMVSFGVAPSFYAYQVIYLGVSFSNQMNYVFIIYFAFLIAAFSALRLAKFNIDETQTDHFVGIPTPITGLFVISFPAFIKMFLNTSYYELAMNPYIMIAVIIFASLMLVAPVKMIALKFKDFSIKNNLFRYIFILISFVTLAKFAFAGFIIVYFVYIITSLISNIVNK